VLSSPGVAGDDAQGDWDDELGRLIGPELCRIPLLYASASQALISVTRSLSRLCEAGAGLVTPVDIQKYSNGLRLLFKPRKDNFPSSWGDYDAEPPEVPTVTAKTGYVSPETEARLTKSKTKLTTEESEKKVPAAALEGGLEIFFDEVPYRRVRIRRCSMGPKTVIKEESESFLIKSITNIIQVLENDYRILLSTDFTKT
jgi:hypothetical protein